MDARRSVGRFGEDVAARHLASLGCEVLARNWRCARGEIDLVARDGDCVVIVEVKTRRSVTYGNPLEAITAAKAARLRSLASLWLAESGERPPHLRIDAIGVLIPIRGAPVIDHRRGVA